MAQETVRLLIPFEALADSVAELTLEGKRRLWGLLWERDPTVQAEIREARAAYQVGDYVTIDEYIAQKRQGEGSDDHR
jgi:hypothetical protein